MLEPLAVIVLGAICLWAIASPFLKADSPGDADGRSADTAVEAAKESKYREIRDAETDYRSGKMSEAQWRAVDADLREEATRILEGEGRREAPRE